MVVECGAIDDRFDVDVLPEPTGLEKLGRRRGKGDLLTFGALGGVLDVLDVFEEVILSATAELNGLG